MTASRYPEPKRVELRLADTDRLTLLEYGRALAAANVRDRDAPRLLGIAFRVRRDGDPADVAHALELCYAIVWQFERRLDPALTWGQAQTWDVVPLEATPAELEAARIESGADELVAQVALGTGLPPGVAGELTMSQVRENLDARAAAADPKYRRHTQRRARVRR